MHALRLGPAHCRRVRSRSDSTRRLLPEEPRVAAKPTSSTCSPQRPNAPGATQLLRGSATRMPALVLLKEVHQLRRIELFVGTQICSIIPSDRIDCVVHC